MSFSQLLIMALTVNPMGNIAIASFHIVMRLASLSFMPGFGFAICWINQEYLYRRGLILIFSVFDEMQRFHMPAGKNFSLVDPDVIVSLQPFDIR